MQNMQNTKNMPNMEVQKSKISESASDINSRTCLGHLVLFQLFLPIFSTKMKKTIGSQSDILFHEILDVQKIRVFFFLALKFWRNS